MNNEPVSHTDDDNFFVGYECEHCMQKKAQKNRRGNNGLVLMLCTRCLFEWWEPEESLAPDMPVVGDDIDIPITTVSGKRRWIRAQYYAPGIAVHPSETPGIPGWSVTHTHTGCIIMDGIPDKDGAMIVANYLYRADWSAPADGELTTVVARSSVQRVYKRAYNFVRRYHPHRETA